MSWLWALLLRLIGRAAATKLPRGDVRAHARAGALASIEELAETIEDFRARGGGEHFLPDDEAFLRGWLDALERYAFLWAPRAASRRLGARHVGDLTCSILTRRAAIVAELLGGPRERPLRRRMGVYRKLLRRTRRRPRRQLAPARAPRPLEFSG